MSTKRVLLALTAAAAFCGFAASQASAAKIVFIAGPPSHGPGDHEHRAGCLLLAKSLSSVPGVTSMVYSNGWPHVDNAFEDAAAVIMFSDGGGGHPVLRGDRLKVLDALVDKGVGIGCLHYAVEVPKDRAGKEFLKWIGGYFETYYSVNPFWEANFKTFPDHPVTRGVKPFKLRDEWYYHMRFPEDMKGVTPILTDIPPDSTRGRPGANEPHGGNPEVQKHKGQPEHVMWVFDRPDGGRGFGFTGGHSNAFWGNESFRKVVLNAILWTAKVEVPAGGVESTVTPEDLKANLDPK